ncbi:MAG TPA: ATP-dependent DNA helicase RecQ, partial [Candidatus Binatia bacterium]|nr:ATP-dependent DNA helicase RecQ [Candidatus Binatia bacterium]
MGLSKQVCADLDAALAKLGYASFRPGQREAIETLLDVNRLLLVAPTGGGKSLTYQLPATLLPGTTLVVSPLVSLMADQVAALESHGVSATYLAATLAPDEIKARMRAMAEGRYKLVYVAPERLAFEGFRGLLAKLECPLVAVDEAHCISEWGHDFRPEYMQIGQLIAELRHCRVLACTATATPIVRDEILERLGLDPSTPQMVHGFARPNLALRVGEVTSRREREERVDEVLAEAIGTPGADRGRAIVYSPTRRLAEEESQRLAEAGWRAHAYHAGLSGRERERVQGEFLGGRAEVIVATNAFGMGIDRPDVRVVVHLAPPGSVEAYYQEVGRAGRDGADAIGLLLISPGDMAVRRHLIESDVEGRVPDPETVRHRWNLFLELMRWAEGGSCRHDAILRYFSDEKETLSGCGRCDNCLGLEDAGTTDDEE